MKLAITSDTHLGDPLCSLVEWNGNDYKKDQSIKTSGKQQEPAMITSFSLEISWISQ